MVDALASDRSDQPFGEAVLPRRAWGDGLVADAHGAQSVRDGSAIDAIPITDQVARRLSPRECFGDLACDPVRGRMGCDVDPDKVSAGPDAWLCTKVHEPCNGGPHGLTHYFPPLHLAPSKPSFSSSA